MIRHTDPRLIARMVNRKLMPRLFAGVLPYMIVNEFPKSGGTWVGQMLADAMDLPFPRHRALGLRSAIVHGHYLSPLGLRNVLTVWRDPRDVAVSYYYHCYFVNEHHNAKLVAFMQAELPFDDYADIRANLPAFLTFLNETPRSPDFTWSTFARTWAGRPGTVQARYEDLRADTGGELTRIVRELTGGTLEPARAGEIAGHHSFERARARAAERVRETGADMSFVREGATGGWRRHFTDEAEALAERYYGPEMARLGYT